jgi:hypothetical protein
MKKKDLHLPFGSSDVEHLALAIYREFHNEKESDCSAWNEYAKWKDDEIVEFYRQLAYDISEEAYGRWKMGIGTVYDMSAWEKYDK